MVQICVTSLINAPRKPFSGSSKICEKRIRVYPDGSRRIWPWKINSHQFALLDRLISRFVKYSNHLNTGQVRISGVRYPGLLNTVTV